MKRCQDSKWLDSFNYGPSPELSDSARLAVFIFVQDDHGRHHVVVLVLLELFTMICAVLHRVRR